MNYNYLTYINIINSITIEDIRRLETSIIEYYKKKNSNQLLNNFSGNYSNDILDNIDFAVLKNLIITKKAFRYYIWNGSKFNSESCYIEISQHIFIFIYNYNQLLYMLEDNHKSYYGINHVIDRLSLATNFLNNKLKNELTRIIPIVIKSSEKKLLDAQNLIIFIVKMLNLNKKIKNFILSDMNINLLCFINNCKTIAYLIDNIDKFPNIKNNYEYISLKFIKNIIF
jgi:hypothetical protein